VSGAPLWVDKRALLLLHKESLAQFGGADGLRDEGLLDSALARPVNKHSYEGCNDLATLAAAYGFGLARNHPFVDGNKRAAFLAVGVFLAMNGQRLTATPIDAIEAILALATGSLEEPRFADWIKAHVRAAGGQAL
jgi:death-on-curing protein